MDWRQRRLAGYSPWVWKSQTWLSDSAITTSTEGFAGRAQYCNLRMRFCIFQTWFSGPPQDSQSYPRNSISLGNDISLSSPHTKSFMIKNQFMRLWKFQYLYGESESWRPRRASGFVLIWVQRSKNWKSQQCDSSLNDVIQAGSRPRKSQCIRLSLKAANKSVFQFKGSQGERILPLGKVSLLVYFGLQLIRWGSLTLERAICLSQSVYWFKC